VEEVQVRVDLSLFVIKTTKDDSLELSRFIVAYFFVLLFITSCTTTHQLNNSSSLQINTSSEITGSRKMVRLSLENYALSILRSFDVSRLKRFWFDTADKATPPSKPLEKDKNINRCFYRETIHECHS